MSCLWKTSQIIWIFQLLAAQRLVFFFFFSFSSQLFVDCFEGTSLPSVISSLQQSELPVKPWYSTSQTNLHELQQKPWAQKPIQPYTPADTSENCQQGIETRTYHIPWVVCKHLELGWIQALTLSQETTSFLWDAELRSDFPHIRVTEMQDCMSRQALLWDWSPDHFSSETQLCNSWVPLVCSSNQDFWMHWSHLSIAAAFPGDALVSGTADIAFLLSSPRSPAAFPAGCGPSHHLWNSSPLGFSSAEPSSHFEPKSKLSLSSWVFLTPHPCSAGWGWGRCFAVRLQSGFTFPSFS